jgi:hypothetical protein
MQPLVFKNKSEKKFARGVRIVSKLSHCDFTFLHDFGFDLMQVLINVIILFVVSILTTNTCINNSNHYNITNLFATGKCNSKYSDAVFIYNIRID